MILITCAFYYTVVKTINPESAKVTDGSFNLIFQKHNVRMPMIEN